MGERGPPPKRSSQRRRRNQDSKPETIPVIGDAAEAPAPLSTWHPAAKRWYRSLAESGQAEFYEPSDWQAAQIVATELSVYLRAKKRSAMMFSHLWSAMTDLLTTEGSRRRVKLEIERTPPPSEEDEEAATITRLDEFRERATG